jgi:hypothetical protein
VFQLTGNNANFGRGKTTVEFTTSDVRVLGKPWVIGPKRLLVIVLINKEANPGFYDVVVESDGEECVLEGRLLIE